MTVLITLVMIADFIFFFGGWPFLYYFMTLTVALVMLFAMYAPRLPRKDIPGIIVCALLVIGLAINEMWNCKTMMEWKGLPYHALVELVGFFFFFFLCRFVLEFYRLHEAALDSLINNNWPCRIFFSS